MFGTWRYKFLKNSGYIKRNSETPVPLRKFEPDWEKRALMMPKSIIMQELSHVEITHLDPTEKEMFSDVFSNAIADQQINAIDLVNHWSESVFTFFGRDRETKLFVAILSNFDAVARKVAPQIAEAAIDYRNTALYLPKD